MGGTTTLDSNPIGIAGGSHGAQQFRRMVFATTGPGVIESGQAAVSQRSAGANMSVDVAACNGLIVEGEAVSDQGHYFASWTSTTNVTLTAADGSNPRIDRIVAEIKDDDHDLSGQTEVQVRAVDGTPTASADLDNLSGAASVPAGSVLLANVLVAAGDTAITDSEIETVVQIAHDRSGVGVQAFTDSGTAVVPGARLITGSMSTTGKEIDLPAAMPGLELEAANIGSNHFTIGVSGSDVIIDNLTTDATGFGMPAGARAKFIGVSPGVWLANYIGTVTTAGSITPSAGTGGKSFTGVGFRPKIVEFVTAFGAGVTGFSWSQGFMHADGTEQLQSGRYVESGASACQYTNGTICTGWYDVTGTPYDYATFTSMDEDGFTINYADNTNQIKHWYRAWA